MSSVLQGCCITCTACRPVLRHPEKGSWTLWTKSTSSVCFKGESWCGWNTRQLGAEERHELPGQKMESVQVEDLLISSHCVVMDNLPNVTFNCLWRILHWKSRPSAEDCGETQWARPHEQHLEMHYTYVQQILQSPVSAALRWKASETPFPMSWWRFPAGMQRLLPGLAQTICWE